MTKHDRVLHRDARDRRRKHGEEERGRMAEVDPSVAIGAVLASAAEVEMLRAAVGEEGAGRVRDHQIPALVQDVAGVSHDVRPRPLGGQQVAGHRIVATCEEGVPDHARELAGDKHTHGQS
jgi:hypothetical protein